MNKKRFGAGIGIIGLFILAIVFGIPWLVANGSPKVLWKDVGVVKIIGFEPIQWYHEFTVQTENHGVIHAIDGPNGNMTVPFLGGCGSYTFGPNLNDTVGIILRQGCGYEMSILLKA